MKDKHTPDKGLPAKPTRFLQYLWYNIVHSLPAGRRRNGPVFIVGCGHSGTSLMLRMLGAHSRIHAIQSETYAAVGERAEEFAVLARNFGKSAAMNWRPRWAEKTPKHVEHVEFIRRHLPEAKFIGIVRDPRDVANSLKKRFGDLAAGIDRWISDNNELLSHRGEPWFHVVRYEDLVSDPRATMASIMNFLDEHLEESQLEFHRQPVSWYEEKTRVSGDAPPPQDNSALRNWQINQPLFDGRRKWEKELTSEEVGRVVELTSDLGRQLGYML
jgi:hypothetical protein